MISGIVLAAGTSSRFGRTKQLVEFRGKPLVLHAVDALRGAGLEEVVVVTGHDAEAVEALLPTGVRIVRNERYAEGQASSLAAGLHALAAESEAAVILVADQPGITAEHVARLTAAFERSRARVVRLAFRDGPGPSLLSREVYAEASHLTGDVGARELIASHPEWVEEAPVDEDAPRDVDTPSDLG
jgi:molybdenum cofactor cytidylyltransferase